MEPHSSPFISFEPNEKADRKITPEHNFGETGKPLAFQEQRGERKSCHHHRCPNSHRPQAPPQCPEGTKNKSRPTNSFLHCPEAQFRVPINTLLLLKAGKLPPKIPGKLMNDSFDHHISPPHVEVTRVVGGCRRAFLRPPGSGRDLVPVREWGTTETRKTGDLLLRSEECGVSACRRLRRLRWKPGRERARTPRRALSAAIS
jgi:hypothetical protein